MAWDGSRRGYRRAGDRADWDGFGFRGRGASPGSAIRRDGGRRIRARQSDMESAVRPRAHAPPAEPSRRVQGRDGFLPARGGAQRDRAQAVLRGVRRRFGRLLPSAGRPFAYAPDGRLLAQRRLRGRGYAGASSRALLLGERTRGGGVGAQVRQRGDAFRAPADGGVAAYAAGDTRSGAPSRGDRPAHRAANGGDKSAPRPSAVHADSRGRARGQLLLR